MPRRNKHKDFSIGKEAIFFESNLNNGKTKPECRGCAFASYGGVCTVSDGKCLLGAKQTTGEDVNAKS